jgi:hypothetical protein
MRLRMGKAMKRKLLGSIALIGLGVLSATKAGHACSYGGTVTCNTYLGTACDGLCDGDVCQGTQVKEYSCTDGSIQFVNE